MIYYGTYNESDPSAKLPLSKEDLDDIFKNHYRWLYSNIRNSEDRAIFYKSNFKNVKFNDYELSHVIFYKCQMFGADFSGTTITDASFEGCCLDHADFSKAGLINVNFRHASLENAYFDSATIRAGCDFSGAFLDGSHWKGACVSAIGINWSNASLHYCDLRDAHNYMIPMACPTDGSFIGWKKAFLVNRKEHTHGPILVKLFIPEDAKRSSATSNKCRADVAKVLGFYDVDTFEEIKINDDQVVVSSHDTSFEYHVGEYVTPASTLTAGGSICLMYHRDAFCDDRFRECAPGIHFFIDKHEAAAYII